MKSFIEAERICQATFQNAGPFWFASSPGKDTPILFATEEDYIFVMNVIAQVSKLFPKVKLLAFEVMDNHFHFVAQAETETMIREFFAAIRKRLQRIFPQIGTIDLDIRPIKDLNSMRNRIVYTHRNGYVVNPDCTPFSYRWGTGRYYFNDYPSYVCLSDLTVRQKRTMFKGRDPLLPDEWKVLEGHISPQSYCQIKFGMAFFRDAHHYMSLLTKNVESYSELADELNDREFLTDPELFAQLLPKVRDQYHVTSMRDLSKAQRLDLAKALRYDYRSSNGQIARLLGLSQYEVDSLFPMKK